MKYDCAKLRTFVRDVMMTTGLSEEDSSIFSDSLVFANMRGVNSHGVTRVGVYRKRLVCDQVDPHAKLKVVEDRPALLLIDGCNGMGAPLAFHAMELCVERAKTTGACFAAIRGGNHFGCAGYFTRYAAEQGMIGVSMADANAIVLPTGARQPMLGTNPLSISVPAYGKEPFLLDMATSVVASGKIKLAAKEGRSIPEGWGMTENGETTTDPSKVKHLMPFGGYKGYGIGMAIDLLSATLSGACDSRHMGSFWKPGDGKIQGTGFFLGVISPAAITDPVEFQKRVAAYIDEMKNAEKADGVEEIFVAGEIEQRKYEKALEEGIVISDVVINELRSIGEETGVPFPFD